MNTHQVDAWYDGLRERSHTRGKLGIGARLIALLSISLNVLLLYALIQLAVALPRIEGQRQAAIKGKEREAGSSRTGEMKIERAETKKGKKDGKRE